MWYHDDPARDLLHVAAIGVPNGLLLGALTGNSFAAVHFGLFSYLGSRTRSDCYSEMMSYEQSARDKIACGSPKDFGEFDWLLGKAPLLQGTAG